MSYIGNLDVQVKETLEQIYNAMYRLVPEEIGTDERVEAEIAQFVRGLANTLLKRGISEAHQQEIRRLKGETNLKSIMEKVSVDKNKLIWG